MIATKVYTKVKANWATQKAILKTQFPKLSDEDLNFDESRKGEMLLKLEVKLALTAKELQVIMEKTR
jgi:hypothetical protein